MKKVIQAALCVTALGISVPAYAALEPGYTPGPRVGTAWYGSVGKDERSADLNFIKGMRPHHAGALTMSQQYLKDPHAKNEALKALARGIIHNQTFEIGMLDMVEGFMKPKATEQREVRQIATKDWGQVQKFIRWPAPSRLSQSISEQDVSKRDVQFAKAMIIHHQAALDMSHEYLQDPAARNGYLELMCLDIITDQAQEIALMNAIISNYPGDPDKVKINASMIHGMEGMNHGGHHGSHSNSARNAHKKTDKKTHEHAEEPTLIEAPAESAAAPQEDHEHHPQHEGTKAPDEEPADSEKEHKPSLIERIKNKFKSGDSGSPDKI